MITKTHTLNDHEYLLFRELILNYSGLHFPEKKRGDLETGLSRSLETMPLGITDLHTYYRFLTNVSTPEAAAEMDRLMKFLTIGETHFFRNDAHFDALKSHILPELIRRKRTMATTTSVNVVGVPQLRVWSAGCATGEEPYSLAMLLRELIPDIANWHIFILATDINQDSLDRARQGIYSAWSFREPRALTMRSRYFTEQGNQYQLRDDIRKMVSFAHHNLAAKDFPAFANGTSAMDLIICRNVMIYFDDETTQALINRFYDALIDRGWLIVGHSEPSLTMYRKFQVQTFPNALLYQKTGQPTICFNDWQGPADVTPGQSLETAVFTVTDDTFTQWLPPDPLPQPAANGTHSHIEPDPMDLDTYQVALQLLRDNQVEQAVAILEDETYPFTDQQRTHAYILLANAYADAGHWHQARAWCDRALKLDTLLPEVYFILAMVHECEGEIESAIANLKKVIYLDRKRPLSHFNLAMLYMKNGQKVQAERALHNAEKILTEWPPEKVIPNSGGTNAKRLLQVVQYMLTEIEHE